MKTIKIFSLFTILLLSSVCQAQEISVPLRFDHYYNYEQVTEALKALNRAYPEITKIEEVGKSEEGRIIWALTINNPATGKELSKPGVYVDGNIHGNEIQAGEVCLYLANRLLTKYSDNEDIKKIVDRNVFYIIPVVNVDGRYHFFNDPNTPSSNRSIRIAMDDDRDGLFDEDFPEDLNDDGSITQMRKKDTLGKLKTDPEDPRLMLAVEPDETGEWTLLGAEGIDNDGDGRVNEDAEGYVDGNRNWGYNWAPPYVQQGSGYYPLQGAGIKAIAEWMIARPNIIMAFAFHNNGGMFLRGPSVKTQGELHPGDIQVYDYLGKNAEKIVPGYRYLISWKDLYATYGDFTDFCDNIIGSYSFVGELFQVETETYDGTLFRKSEEQSLFGSSNEQSRERLKYNDHVTQGELYHEWESYNHPVYGEIEIGGWSKMSSRLPHAFMLQDLVHRNASAVIFAAKQTPDVSLEVFENKKIDKDLYRIRVRLHNKGAMSSMLYSSVANKLYPKDKLSLSIKSGSVISGGKLTDVFNSVVEYKKHKPEIQYCQVPGFDKVEYQFLVSGKGKVVIDYESRKAGNKSVEVELK
ncbi:MAG: M14 family metallopeptidase [Bacteroidales bacterium]|nr:M14 family metallopeptidase [Bacteroidales bacterium]